MLFITGVGSSFYIFLLAEFFNALSLGLLSGTYSAYLLDVNKASDTSKRALQIFGAYQDYALLVMACVSVVGAVAQAYQWVNVRIMAACIMAGIFVLSLVLPTGNFSRKNPDSLKKTLQHLIQVFSPSTDGNQKVLYCTVVIMVATQIYIQFWQVLVPGNVTAAPSMRASCSF